MQVQLSLRFNWSAQALFPRKVVYIRQIHYMFIIKNDNRKVPFYALNCALPFKWKSILLRLTVVNNL